MVKRINIKSLLHAKESLDGPGYKSFLAYHGIEIREAEAIDLANLVDFLSGAGGGIGSLDKFYVGFRIPQIGKEFDLLRFGPKVIVNIELKSTCSEEKIQKQLLRNKYYLDFIGREVFALTYVSDAKELYCLCPDGKLEKVSAAQLTDLLIRQEVSDGVAPEDLFEPSNYLVSPFNSTAKFLTSSYFLTNQQEDIKSQILGSFKSPKESKFISLKGSAGTGKTLLTYDIAKEMLFNGKKPLIIHCGQLNGGHHQLNGSGWTITAIKGYANYDFVNFDLIVVDEAQRIYPKQLDAIIEQSIKANCPCIFSHDKLQTLANWEEARGVSDKISAIPLITEYKLSEKIRTNKEIAAFIKMLFNNKRIVPLASDGNIEINYFSTDDDAKAYMDALDTKKWEVLRFTPSQYNKEHHEKYSEASKRTSHQVIGQEFDGVAVPIDRFFSYAENGDLIYKGAAYYEPAKMLFQNITRSRKKLNIIIIGNAEVLSRCMSILQ